MQSHRKVWLMRQELREERQSNVLQAVMQIAAGQGLGAVSLRSVADEAGTSMGQVQYQFGKVADLRLRALERAIDHIDRAVATAQSEVGQDRLKVMAHAMLDADRDHRLALSAFAELRSLARTDPRARAAVEAMTARRRCEIAEVLSMAQRRRILHKLIDPEHEAAVSWSLLLSVSIEVADGVRERSDAEDLVLYHFRRLARNKRITRPPRTEA